jgi:peptide/nickel transport system ATP-binding protein
MHPTMNAIQLHIKNLCLDFKTEQGLVPALQNVDIEVPKGAVVAIVGESGSGKSVTSMSIMQLLPKPPAVYSAGEILFTKADGSTVDLLQLSADEMRQIRGKEIAMIFQEPMTSLNPVFTCGNQVMEAILLHEKISKREAKAKTIAIFEKVKLPNPAEMFDRYPHELSGGQKQRVMISMAICCAPSLLICDEPTTALDVTVQKTILQLIKDLQLQQQMTVIFITHDLGVVAEIADHVLVMHKGVIVEQGDVQQIFNAAKHPYTKGLLACRPILHPKGKRLPVVADFLNAKEEVAMHFADVAKSKIANEALVRVENLKVHFPTKKNWLGKPLAFAKAVDDVSFNIFKGETLGLVGESGCGKTTLGRSILRLIEPTSGNIFFDGKNFLNYSAKELRPLRKQMQIVFQDPYSSLNPRLTIGDAIAEPLGVHGLLKTQASRKEKVVDLLEHVSMQADQYNRYPHEFSGGQRQRIVIARALALNPNFIVFDESVSALDVSVQAQVLNLINDLKAEFNFTAIFISHDLGVVRYISDRIMVMQKGKIVEMGEADDVFYRPKELYTQQLIKAIPGT